MPSRRTRKRKRKPRDPDRVVARPPRARAKLPVWKKLLFAAVITVVFFGCLEGLLALFGVRSVSYREDPYLGFSSQAPLFVEQADDNGRTEMVTAENKVWFFNRQHFPKTKPTGTYRIFCLGGSTTYGRPYNDLTSFCGWLRAFLPEADPSRQWELINAGGISYASYRVAMLSEELVRYEPDLLIIYTGQNEFLERRTYPRLINTPRPVRGLGALLSRTRTYTIVKRAVDPLAGIEDHDAGASRKRELLEGEVNTILDAAVGPKDYHRDDQFQKQVLDHYRYNLVRTIHVARSVGAEVMLVTPASNLLHCWPFKSEHRPGLTDDELTRWQALFDRAEKAYAAGQWQQALTALDQAMTVDGRYAHLHYLRGRTLYELGRYRQAKIALERARDEDVCPLRALGPMPRIVAEVAADWDVPLVDFADLVEDRSDHGIPGENLFLDHVHPTIDGNRLLASAILDKMVRQRIVSPARDWNDRAIARVTQSVESRLDLRAHATALRNLAKVLSWAGKLEEARKLATKAAELVPDDAVAHFQLGVCAEGRGDLARAAVHYRRALEVAPNFAKAHTNLGSVLQQSGETALAVRHFMQATRLDPDDHKALFNLGRFFRKQGKLEPAAEHFQHVIRLHPRDAEARAQLAAVLLQMGKLPEATAEMEKAVELRPDLAKMHNRLGLLWVEAGAYAEAAQSYRRALEQEPEHADALSNLAWLLATAPDQSVRNGAEAVRLAEQACRRD
ncbi:MAG: tetratricopeptide repeat protein, partial [Planctomycetota bacterium]